MLATYKTPDEILKNRHTLDHFIVGLAHRKITNVRGSACRCHPQMYWERGVLITSHWHTSNRCDIKVAVPKDAVLIPGCNDSLSQSGNPYPSLVSGEFVTVWSDGWKKDGPWVAVVHDILSGLIQRVQEHDAEQARISEEKKVAAEARRVASEKSLHEAWN